MTLAGFSVCQTSVKDCPGLIDAGSAVKLTILAGNVSRLSYKRIHQNPPSTAPGALGAGWPAGGCAGACAQTSAIRNYSNNGKCERSLHTRSFLGLHHPAVAKFHERTDHRWRAALGGAARAGDHVAGFTVLRVQP